MLSLGVLRLKLLNKAFIPLWECYVSTTKYSDVIKIEIVTQSLQYTSSLEIFHLIYIRSYKTFSSLALSLQLSLLMILSSLLLMNCTIFRAVCRCALVEKIIGL